MRWEIAGLRLRPGLAVAVTAALAAGLAGDTARPVGGLAGRTAG